MVLKSTFTIVAIATLALFSQTPQVEAHSWVDCVDWRFSNPNTTRVGGSALKGDKKSLQDWSKGECHGYARRYPLGKPFGSLDSADPNRHYQQTHKNPKPDDALACSDGKHGEEPGSDETRAKPESGAYGGKGSKKKYGQMTVTKVGDSLCLRWPAKNHAVKDEVENHVQIYLNPTPGQDITNQRQLLQHKIKVKGELNFKNCNEGKNQDRRTCGGCFTVPDVVKDGIYQLQWRWMLNKDEWYTSCADVKISKK